MNKCAAFMMGLSFGAGVALLSAPRSGLRTRVMLARKTKKGADYIKNQATSLANSATELVEKGQDLMDRGQEEVAQYRDGLRRAVAMGKRAYRESVG